MEHFSGLLDVTADRIQKLYGTQVEEAFLILAKHEVLGSSDSAIMEVLQIDETELTEARKHPNYRFVKDLVIGVNAQAQIRQSAGWDQLEATSLAKLAKKIETELDKEFLLKTATLANRAQRRLGNQSNVLDPTGKQGVTIITLTERISQKLSYARASEVRERTVSITDGSATNPSFEEVKSLLHEGTVHVGRDGKLQSQEDFDLHDYMREYDKLTGEE